jgi:hypothetical protein
MLLALALGGCGRPAEKPVLGEHVQPAGVFNPFYAEKVFKNKMGRDTIVLIGKASTWKAWQGGAHELPFSKTITGAGPNGETVLVESEKDDSGMTYRLLRQFRARWGLKAD